MIIGLVLVWSWLAFTGLVILFFYVSLLDPVVDLVSTDFGCIR